MRRYVLVGDPCQLPATVLSRGLAALGLERSLFERLAAAGWPVVRLSVQYRMHPSIRRFPGRHFYDNALSVRAAVQFEWCIPNKIEGVADSRRRDGSGELCHTLQDGTKVPRVVRSKLDMLCGRTQHHLRSRCWRSGRCGHQPACNTVVLQPPILETVSRFRRRPRPRRHGRWRWRPRRRSRQRSHRRPPRQRC